MRYSEFWALADEVFGASYARTLASTQTLSELGSRTVDEALADGVDPRTVWHVLCDAMGIAPEDRWGADPRRQAPPRGGA